MSRFDATDLYLLSVLALFQSIEFTRSARASELFAQRVAQLAYHTSRAKRATIRANLAQYFGEKYNARDLEPIVRGTFESFWGDACMLLNVEMRSRLERANVRGIEHIEHALAQGHGAILFENSFFGQRSAVKRILFARGFKAHQTHSREHLGGFFAKGETQVRERVIRPFFETREKKYVASILYLPRGESLAVTRHLMHLLQRNEMVYLSGEGQIAHKHVEFKFLNGTRRFATGAIHLAKLTHAPLLPTFCWRDEKDTLQLVIESPLAFPNGAHAAEIGMQQFVDLLEKYIRQFPAQYRNWQASYLT